MEKLLLNPAVQWTTVILALVVLPCVLIVISIVLGRNALRAGPGPRRDATIWRLVCVWGGILLSLIFAYFILPREQVAIVCVSLAILFFLVQRRLAQVAEPRGSADGGNRQGE